MDSVQSDTARATQQGPVTLKGPCGKGGHGDRSRAWCITNFNDPIWHPENAQYDLMCSDTTKEGIVHYHQYLYFKNPVAFSTVKKNYPSAHIEHEYKDYVHYIKENKNGRKTIIYEQGKVPCKIRTIEDAKKATQEEIDMAPVQNYKMIKMIQNDARYEEARHNKFIKDIDFQWHFGPTGTGKSYDVFLTHECVEEDGSNKVSDWGDAKNIVFEEFTGKMPYDMLKKMTDKYHNYYKVRVLYGWRLVDFESVRVCSPEPPWNVYKGQIQKQDSINQLMRRLNWVVYEHKKQDGKYFKRIHHWSEENQCVESVDPWIECTEGVQPINETQPEELIIEEASDSLFEFLK